MNLIFIGHIDHGKSTSVGRLLYETKAVTEQDMKKRFGSNGSNPYI